MAVTEQMPLEKIISSKSEEADIAKLSMLLFILFFNIKKIKNTTRYSVDISNNVTPATLPFRMAVKRRKREAGLHVVIVDGHSDVENDGAATVSRKSKRKTTHQSFR